MQGALDRRVQAATRSSATSRPTRRRWAGCTPRSPASSSVLTVSSVPTVAGQRLVVSIAAAVRSPADFLAARNERGRGPRAAGDGRARSRAPARVAAPVAGGRSSTYYALLSHAAAAGKTVYSVERADRARDPRRRAGAGQSRVTGRRRVVLRRRHPAGHRRAGASTRSSRSRTCTWPSRPPAWASSSSRPSRRPTSSRRFAGCSTWAPSPSRSPARSRWASDSGSCGQLPQLLARIERTALADLIPGCREGDA